MPMMYVQIQALTLPCTTCPLIQEAHFPPFCCPVAFLFLIALGLNLATFWTPGLCGTPVCVVILFAFKVLLSTPAV